MRALYIASTGMAAQESNVNTISNNIANMRTTGYKRQRVNFQDLMYQNMRRAGSTTSETGNILPAGVEIGSGVKVVSTPRIMTQGNISMSEKDYDVAIRGEGFLRIQLPDGTTAYTRDGSFELNDQGQLVTSDGYIVDPGITIPQDATDVTINGQGEVQVRIPGQVDLQAVGQLQLSRFINKAGLESIGDNLFLETPASGEPITANPGNEGFGSLLHRYLEEANVNSVTEISDLIAAQRAYEMNARVVTAADSMLQATSSLGR